MKLGVTTICPHLYYQGAWWSFEPYVVEMNMWHQLFPEMVIAAPLDHGEPPPFWAPYATSEGLEVVPYRENQGKGLVQSKTSLFEIPRMISSILKVAHRSDVFHLRSPGSIGLISSLVAPLVARYRIAKYAGQWNGYPEEPRSVRLQRAILSSRWWGAPVTVYGEWPDQAPHVIPFFTSVMTDAQMDKARDVASCKTWSSPLRLLFVGRLSPSKNVDTIIRAIALVAQTGVVLHCDILGDGDERAHLQALAQELGVTEMVQFHGGVTFKTVLSFYEQADILILLSKTEGWPKVVAEAMAFGLVCIGSDLGLVSHILGEGRGIALPPGDVDALAETLEMIAADPQQYNEMRLTCAAWAQQYTLEGLRDALQNLLRQSWNLPPQALATEL